MNSGTDERLAARRALYVEEFGGIEAEHRRNLTVSYVAAGIMAFVCGVAIGRNWHPFIALLVALSAPGLIRQAKVACAADAERRMAYGID